MDVKFIIGAESIRREPLMLGVMVNSKHRRFISVHDCDKPLLGGLRMFLVFLEELHLQLHGAGRDFYWLRGLVASALFQTDLLPSWICVSGPSVQPRLWLWPVMGGGRTVIGTRKNPFADIKLVSITSSSSAHAAATAADVFIIYRYEFCCIFKVWTKKNNVTHKACVLFGINLMTSACDFRIRRIKLMLCYHLPHPCEFILLF